MRKKLEEALRELVGAMYRDLHGAYGGADYEGYYESEIQKVIDAIIDDDESTEDDKKSVR